MKLKNRNKFIILVLNIVFLLITLSIVPINIFVFNIPRWVLFLSSAISTSLLLYYLIHFQTKIITKVLLFLIFAFFISGSIFISLVIPYWNNTIMKSYKGEYLNYDDVISSSLAKEDIDEMMNLVKRIHPFVKFQGPFEIEKAYDNVIKELESVNEITVNELRKKIQQILYPLHDAHTSTYNNWPHDLYLKDALSWLMKEYDFYSVNNLTTEDLNSLIEPYFSYENKDGIYYNVISLALLDFLNIQSPYTFIWKNENDEKQQVVYTKEDFVTAQEFNKYSNELFPPKEDTESFVYYEIYEERSFGILTLKKCLYNKYYKDCVQNMFKEVKQKGIKNVAIDVRNNGGGNSLVCNEVIKYLPVITYKDCPSIQRFNFFTVTRDKEIKNKQKKDLLFQGNIYVLTNKASFSSAMTFAQIIQDNHIGYVVGEASTNNCNSYGDITGFNLHNSGIFIQISTKKWYRIDKENKSSYVIPDYPCNSEDAVHTVYNLIG